VNTFTLSIDPDKVSLDFLYALRYSFEKKQAHEGGCEGWLKVVNDAIAKKLDEYEQANRQEVKPNS
jgi:sarcosine oxidase delta subunit